MSHSGTYDIIAVFLAADVIEIAKLFPSHNGHQISVPWLKFQKHKLCQEFALKTLSDE